MASPMTPDQLVHQLQKWGVPYREIPGWRTYGRDAATGKPFGPVYGCMTHHTGDDAPDRVDSKVIHEGRVGLPGPLAHFGVPDDGTVEIHSLGRANHAGGGDGKVLTAVINESYDKYPPRPHFHEGMLLQTDGNDCFYGAECYYSGTHKMTAKQYRSLVLLWAAICDFHGWTGKSVIGHKEWSDWKSDPASQDMHQLRLDVDQALQLGPPSKRVTPTRVTEASKLLDEAIKILDEVPDWRKLVCDVRDKIEVQRARLPER